MAADVQWWSRLAGEVRAAGRGEVPVEAPLRAVRDHLGFDCAALVSGGRQDPVAVNLGYPDGALGYITTTYRWKCPVHQRAIRLGMPLRFVDVPEVRETRTYREVIQPNGFREGVTVPLGGAPASFVAFSSTHGRPLDDDSRLALAMLSHDLGGLVDPGAEAGDARADAVLAISRGRVEVRAAAIGRVPLADAELRLAAQSALDGPADRVGFHHRDADGSWWRVLARVRRPDGVLVRICRAPDFGPLTGRELDVVGLVARGWSNERISAALGITVRTVRSHVESSLVKLGCANRTTLARQALEQDLDTLGALEAAQR